MFHLSTTPVLALTCTRLSGHKRATLLTISGDSLNILTNEGENEQIKSRRMCLTALEKKAGEETERRGQDGHTMSTPATNWPGTR